MHMVRWFNGDLPWYKVQNHLKQIQDGSVQKWISFSPYLFWCNYGMASLPWTTSKSLNPDPYVIHCCSFNWDSYQWIQSCWHGENKIVLYTPVPYIEYSKHAKLYRIYMYHIWIYIYMWKKHPLAYRWELHKKFSPFRSSVSCSNNSKAQRHCAAFSQLLMAALKLITSAGIAEACCRALGRITCNARHITFRSFSQSNQK